MTTTHEYKEKLEAERIIVEAELRSLGIQNPDVPADWIAVAEDTSEADADENVLADKYEDLGTRTALVVDLETRYNNIHRALAKIEAGTYGVCEHSGEAIEPERLDANPAARTCILHREEEGDLAS